MDGCCHAIRKNRPTLAIKVRIAPSQLDTTRTMQNDDHMGIRLKLIAKV
jgi:hypothetical protein